MFNGSAVNISGNSIIINCIQLCQDIFYALEYIEQHVSTYEHSSLILSCIWLLFILFDAEKAASCTCPRSWLFSNTGEDPVQSYWSVPQPTRSMSFEMFYLPRIQFTLNFSKTLKLSRDLSLDMPGMHGCTISTPHTQKRKLKSTTTTTTKNDAESNRTNKQTNKRSNEKHLYLNLSNLQLFCEIVEDSFFFHRNRARV